MTEFTRDLDTGLIVPANEPNVSMSPDVIEEPEELDPTTRGDEARALAEELKQFKLMMNYSCIRAGEILERILSTKAYKKLDYKSFTAFLADPDYGMPKSTAYLYLHLYRFYVKELGLDRDSLSDIDVVRLRDMIAIIKKEPERKEDWLAMARTLGKGDFINELRHAKGLDSFEIMPPSPDETEVVVVRTDYSELCRASECIICGKRPVDFHHFPRTKGAGADDDKVIPLCRWCHSSFHQDPKAMLWEHRVKIFDWFYGIIFGLLGVK